MNAMALGSEATDALGRTQWVARDVVIAFTEMQCKEEKGNRMGESNLILCEKPSQVGSAQVHCYDT